VALDADRLRRLWERGRAAYPALAVTDQMFANHLGAVAARDPDESAPLEERFVEDLYLACACLNAVPNAAEAFDAACAPAIRAAIARLAPGDAARDELVQATRDALLVPRPGEPARLVSYLGTGPLPRWVATTGQRLALLSLRSARVEERAHGALAKEAAPPADPELAYLKHQYKGDFETVLADLVTGLEERERVILRLHLIDGLSADKIGKMFGMSRATAQRRVEEVREKIADGVRRSMRERLELSGSDAGSVAGLVASQIDISLSRILRVR
jgi:RNA polymerase sigma-70 factor (ECF subfamily)